MLHYESEGVARRIKIYRIILCLRVLCLAAPERTGCGKHVSRKSDLLAVGCLFESPEWAFSSLIAFASSYFSKKVDSKKNIGMDIFIHDYLVEQFRLLERRRLV